MASVRFPKGSEYFTLFMDFWELCQKHWQPEERDDYWEEVIKDTDAFCKKYDNELFSRALALALVDELERKSNGGKNKI